MNFGMITDELNMQETKQVIHSILNAGCEASIVIDRSSFEILWLSKQIVPYSYLRQRGSCVA